MPITAGDVKALRERTGMGMMECKKALSEADGDMAAAVEILRKAAKGKMDERTDREAVEGAIAIAVTDDRAAAAIVELNTETDFTAKNDAFVAAADQCAEIALSAPVGPVAVNDAISEAVDAVRLTTKENCSFKRGEKVTGTTVGYYVHHNRQVGALVVVEGGSLDAETLTGLAQHVVAHVPTPVGVDEADLPADDLAAARQQFIDEAKASGKPDEIAEKMSTGRMRKWVDERTLLGQSYVKDMTGKTQVKDLLSGAKVTRFIRYEIGVA